MVSEKFQKLLHVFLGADESSSPIVSQIELDDLCVDLEAMVNALWMQWIHF